MRYGVGRKSRLEEFLDRAHAGKLTAVMGSNETTVRDGTNETDSCMSSRGVAHVACRRYGEGVISGTCWCHERSLTSFSSCDVECVQMRGLPVRPSGTAPCEVVRRKLARKTSAAVLLVMGHAEKKQLQHQIKFNIDTCTTSTPENSTTDIRENDSVPALTFFQL